MGQNEGKEFPSFSFRKSRNTFEIIKDSFFEEKGCYSPVDGIISPQSILTDIVFAASIRMDCRQK